ncbi:MAG: fimbrial assembly protein [Zetaproteobacteria bacterium]|nr:MAG: fimbrial assembly protein [Zetaproteobacteria bacterium]
MNVSPLIRINLLPYRELRWRLKLLKMVSVAAAVFLSVVVLIVTVHLVTRSHLDRLVAEEQALQEENRRLKRKIGKIRNIDKLRADVEAKLGVIDTLQEGRFRTLRLLLAISQAIPENVWVDSIRDDGKRFSIHGRGESNNVVAEFMRQLDASPSFANVRLDVIRRSEVGGVRVRSFELSMEPVDLATPTEKGGRNREHRRRRRR